jgi:hypothetical protein
METQWFPWHEVKKFQDTSLHHVTSSLPYDRLNDADEPFQTIRKHTTWSEFFTMMLIKL